MKPAQYPLGITPETVKALHADYCAKTRMDYPFDPRKEQLWIGLLATHSAPEILMVAGYLRWRVDHEKRLPGCLKLNLDNFFNPTRFADDLAEAKSIKSRRALGKTATVQTVTQRVGGITRQVELPAASADGRQIAEAVKKEAARFRETMRGDR